MTKTEWDEISRLLARIQYTVLGVVILIIVSSACVLAYRVVDLMSLHREIASNKRDTERLKHETQVLLKKAEVSQVDRGQLNRYLEQVRKDANRIAESLKRVETKLKTVEESR